MGIKRFDWEKIKSEYVTEDISLRELAKRHGVSVTTINKYCRNQGWVKARENYSMQVSKRAIQKSCNKRGDELAKVLDSSLLIRDRIMDAMNDPLQFNRYVVTTGSKGGEFHTEEVIKDKVDTKAIKEMTSALKAVESLIRSLNNLPTEADMQRLQIEREKFELEKEKWEKEKAEMQSAHEIHVTFDVDDPDGWME